MVRNSGFKGLKYNSSKSGLIFLWFFQTLGRWAGRGGSGSNKARILTGDVDSSSSSSRSCGYVGNCFLIFHISIAFFFSFSLSDTPSGGGRSGQGVHQSKRLHRRRERSAGYEESPPYRPPIFPHVPTYILKSRGGAGVKGVWGIGGRGG